MPTEPFPSVTKLGFRRIDAKDPEVRELQNSILALVGDLNAKLVNAYFYGLPIGTPIPFLAAFFQEGYELGPKFLPMDGRTVVNSKSPLHGQVLAAPSTDLGVGAEWWVRFLD